MALGFERMAPGSLARRISPIRFAFLIEFQGTHFPDRPSPMGPHRDLREELEIAGLGANKGPGAARFFGDAGTEYLRKYGGTVEHFAKIGEDPHHPLYREAISTLNL